MGECDVPNADASSASCDQCGLCVAWSECGSVLSPWFRNHFGSVQPRIQESLWFRPAHGSARETSSRCARRSEEPDHGVNAVNMSAACRAQPHRVYNQVNMRSQRSVQYTPQTG